MKNADIKQTMQENGIEWLEISRYMHMPMKDLVRRLNSKTVSSAFRRHLMQAIKVISSRSETFYDENQ